MSREKKTEGNQVKREEVNEWRGQMQQPLKTKPIPKTERTDLRERRKSVKHQAQTHVEGDQKKEGKVKERERERDKQWRWNGAKGDDSETDSGLESSVSSLSSCLILQEVKASIRKIRGWTSSYLLLSLKRSVLQFSLVAQSCSEEKFYARWVFEKNNLWGNQRKRECLWCLLFTSSPGNKIHSE